MNSTQAASRLDAAAHLIAAMRRSIGESPDADLAPLLGAVEAACNAIAVLTPQDARDLLPRVVALLDDVESLERELDTIRKDAKDRLNGMARQRQANSAYGDTSRKRR
jgi:uncharacterized protein Yka (UPF0111/DUF47 family)